MEEARLFARVVLEVFLKYVLPPALIGLGIWYVREDPSSSAFVGLALIVLGLMFVKYIFLPAVAGLANLSLSGRGRGKVETPALRFEPLLCPRCKQRVNRYGFCRHCRIRVEDEGPQQAG